MRRLGHGYMRRLILVPVTLLALLISAPGQAELRALVVAVELDAPGAERDAAELADALRHVHGSDITVLTGPDARPGPVRRELAMLQSRAAAGDLIFFSYAGAGGQQPEQALGSEPDQLDEVLRLGDGDLTTGIRDGELALWASDIAARGALAMLLLDTGYVDAPRRPASSPGSAPQARGLPVQAVRRWPESSAGFAALAEVYRASSLSGLEQMPPRTMVLQATAEPDHAAPTFELTDGTHSATTTTRGALSHAFAQAIRGAADRDGNARITAGELDRHIRATMRQVTDGAARPGIHYRFAPNSTLFFSRGSAGGDHVALPIPLNRTISIEPTRRHAFSARGDLVAEQATVGMAGQITQSRLAIDRLHLLARHSPLDARTVPDHGLWTFGQRFSIRIGDAELPHRLIANITGHGTVQMLYPEARGQSDRPGGLLDDLAILGPFGTDSVVIIATAEPAQDLYQTFRDWDGRPFDPDMATRVSALLERRDFRVAVLPIVSAAGGGASQ